MRNLTWEDLFNLMTRDKGGRWHASHAVCVEYCLQYRNPSRAWPHSHSKPLLTRKFAKWCEVNHPEFAAQFPTATDTEAN